MRQFHDQTSVPHAESSRALWRQARLRSLAAAELPSIDAGTGVDPLSHVLQTVRLTGALFFLVDASSPWGVEVPPAKVFSSVILPRAQHVISYHIVLSGSGWAGIPGVTSTFFDGGDILVFPYGPRRADSRSRAWMDRSGRLVDSGCVGVVPARRRRSRVIASSAVVARARRAL